jgi:hypothetical protein
LLCAVWCWTAVLALKSSPPPPPSSSSFLPIVDLLSKQSFRSRFCYRLYVRETNLKTDDLERTVLSDVDSSF